MSMWCQRRNTNQAQAVVERRQINNQVAVVLNQLAAVSVADSLSSVPGRPVEVPVQGGDVLEDEDGDGEVGGDAVFVEDEIPRPADDAGNLA